MISYDILIIHRGISGIKIGRKIEGFDAKPMQVKQCNQGSDFVILYRGSSWLEETPVKRREVKNYVF